MTEEPAPFVVGMPRSGTTLLRLMLDAHPQLALPPETHFLPDAVAASEGSPAPAEAFCRAVVSSPRWPDFGLAEDELARRLGALRPFEIGAALRSFYRLYAKQRSKPRWGDKTPPYLRHMTTIQWVLPESRFVHVIRDGRDVACSIVALPWGPRTVAEAAGWWRTGITHARQQSSRLEGYVEVRYEDLVTEPERVLREVCELISLPFSPAMLSYHRRSEERMAELDRDLIGATGKVLLSAAERAEMHTLSRSPPRTDRVGRWRTELGDAERAEFEAIAGSLLDELGYETSRRSSR